MPHQNQLPAVCWQHLWPHIRSGRTDRQLCKAQQHVQLCQQGGHSLPHLHKGVGHTHNLQGRQCQGGAGMLEGRIEVAVGSLMRAPGAGPCSRKESKASPDALPDEGTSIISVMPQDLPPKVPNEGRTGCFQHLI